MTAIEKTEKALTLYADLLRATDTRKTIYGDISGITECTVKAINNAVNALNETDKIIIDMFYREHRTLKYIAYKLGISAPSVWRHKQAAVERLSVILFSEDYLKEHNAQ